MKLTLLLERQEEIHHLVDMLEKGELPLRVTHNDTKISNVLWMKILRKVFVL